MEIHRGRAAVTEIEALGTLSKYLMGSDKHFAIRKPEDDMFYELCVPRVGRK